MHLSLFYSLGWSLGEHQEWSKYSVFTTATRVPLIIYMPKITHLRGSREITMFPFLDPFVKKDSVDNDKSKANGNMSKSKQKHSDSNRSRSTDLLFESEHFNFENVNTTQLHSNHKYGKYTPKYNQGFRTNALVEQVDLFPTLAEAAGLPQLPVCPPDPFNVLLCTEGTSLIPLIHNITGRKGDILTGKHSQVIQNTQSIPNNNSASRNMYPSKQTFHTAARNCSLSYANSSSYDSGFEWKSAAFSQFPRPSVLPQENSDKPSLRDIRIMGYSMLTQYFHYVEWVGFKPDTFSIQWRDIYARELYVRSDDPYEINNVAIFDRCHALVKILSAQLQKGWRYA